MTKRVIIFIILILYCAFLIELLVFKAMPVIRIGHITFRIGGTHTGPPNLVPFSSILSYIVGKSGWLFGLINILGNIVLLTPVGFLLPFLWTRMTWKKSIVAAICAGLVLEGLQLIFQVGIFDVDDILLNAFGVVIGYWLSRRVIQKKKSINLLQQ